jgi:exoribonuclease II
VTYALYEDAGKHHAGRILSLADASAQLELDSGKRVKVKTAQMLLRFDSPAPALLLEQAQTLAATIDLDLAWTFAPDDDFGFADLARDYFDAKATLVQQAAALWALHQAPHYFRRLGKGVYRKANAETVKAALAAIEKKRAQAEQAKSWADALIAGECPQPIRDQIYRVLFKPDKNSVEYKAVVDAAKRSQQGPLELLRRAGAIGNAYQFHWKRFLFERFPGGTGHGAAVAPTIAQDLPTASVQAFSIDDSATTEIDDALSVQGLGTGVVTLGIHIAAPGLAIVPGSSLDAVAVERLSTVYIPGWKATMLPDAVVQAYTLRAGQAVAAVSLYVRIDEGTLETLDHETRLERVPIIENLRHDVLDADVTEANLAAPEHASYPFAHELSFLNRLAQTLKLRREAVRGKPENFNRPDPTFTLEGQAEGEEPSGIETIHIGVRRRGAPLDLIVAEAMIVANSTWGAWLAAHGVPGIYRSQASLAPGVKVRMGTKPAPHAGIGVAHYAWSTSPLRRYVDLVNQWQIIACARHGKAAALAAPFKPRDASLMAIVSAFESAYADYATVQRVLERYWMLRWLEQREVREFEGTVGPQGMVRAEAIPLLLPVPGLDTVPRGARVRLRLVSVDTLALEAHASLIARIDDAPGAQAGVQPADEDEGQDGADAAAPLALAIDVNDASEEDAFTHDRAPPARDNVTPSSEAP